MGVQGLWKLVQPIARPIKLETLEGSRLAIDSSIWLYHFQMAMRDKEGRTLSNAHILGFLWRILKLLFHGVRPVFVFDGGAPVMKRKTLAGRKARKQGAKESHARTAEKLLAAQLRQAAIKHIADGPASAPKDQADQDGLVENTVYFDDLQQGRPKPIGASPSASPMGSPEKRGGSPSKPKKDWHKDPYALPALEKDLHTLSAINGRKGKRADYRFATETELRQVMATIAPEDLDTTSELFQSLPPELQYELVGDLRAQSRMTSYKRLQSMLATAPTPIDFSRAQIAGLKTRNDLTQKVLTVTDEIGSANIKVPIRVAGERNKEYVLVRNSGAEGGFVLGVRGAGTSQEKAITVEDDDQLKHDTTDDECTGTHGEIELEMDEVEIPLAGPDLSSDAFADPVAPSPTRPSLISAKSELGSMSPPSRSASQQRLEIKAKAPVSVTPPEIKSPAVEVAPKAAATPTPTAEDLPTAQIPVTKGLAETALTPKEALSAVAAGAGIDDEIQGITQEDFASPQPGVSDDMDVEPEAPKQEETAIPSPRTTRPDSPGTGRRALAPPEAVPVDVPAEEKATTPTPQPAVVLDNIQSAVEAAALPEDEQDRPEPAVSRLSSRDGTPIEWSPSPSPEPVALGVDGFPLPTAEELEAMDAEDEDQVARLNADQNEFVTFLSATKGRSLLDVQQEIESQVNALRAEHANSRKSEEDITRQMAQEIQIMLRLFGLPYITAPMEAEAQCAELVSRRLVDGIITDDSDVFLFGGTRIYKNMFNNNKVVECFLLLDLQRELGLDREKLVRLAYYLGSDYTEGLPGVGPVVAMELLALFPGEDGLLKFREWWLKVQMGKDTPDDTRGETMRRIKKALKNKVHLAPSWPEPEVLDAYYQPRVDKSDEPFQWGLPDLDSLRTFLGEYLHWPTTKTDQYLLPIIERRNQRSRARGNQSTLDRNGFFDSTAGLGVYAGRKKPTYGSNRLQEVVNGFRAATGGKKAVSARKKRGPDEAISSEDDSSDGIEVVESTPTLRVPEEMLGKEMAKRRPIVRAENTPKEGRTAELDAALEGPKASKAKPRSGKAKAVSKKKTEADGSSVDEWRPPKRGRGARGRGRAKVNLQTARNMNLDDVDQISPSRSPSVGPGRLSRRSSSTR